MTDNEMVIFTRSYDLLSWLVPLTNHFPKAQRFTVTQRLLNTAFEMREQLEIAQHRRGRERMAALCLADEALSKLRFYIRLCYHWGWIKIGQYEHAARFLNEIGRLLGGWKKVTKS